tara:strand:- start:1081 stop:1401 length:321 start_codon:yes stop_codon:yes gene_type:complete
MRKLFYLRKKYIYIDVGNNNSNYWFEFRICGVGLDVNFKDYKSGIDLSTNKISPYASDIERKRIKETWSNNLSFKGKLIKWFWINFGWTKGFHMYKINNYDQWRRL